jgi:hypothetical protein
MVVVTVAKLPVGVTRPMVVYGSPVTHDAGGGLMLNLLLLSGEEELWAATLINGNARSHSSRIVARGLDMSR